MVRVSAILFGNILGKCFVFLSFHDTINARKVKGEEQQTEFCREDGMRQIVRKGYRFYGRVQGVGFRYVARHAAAYFGLTGWVRNEYDGSVSMEVQGTAADIRQFLAEIRDARYIEIDEVEEKDLPVDHEERQFKVRH